MASLDPHAAGEGGGTVEEAGRVPWIHSPPAKRHGEREEAPPSRAEGRPSHGGGAASRICALPAKEEGVGGGEVEEARRAPWIRSALGEVGGGVGGDDVEENK